MKIFYIYDDYTAKKGLQRKGKPALEDSAEMAGKGE